MICSMVSWAITIKKILGNPDPRARRALGSHTSSTLDLVQIQSDQGILVALRTLLQELFREIVGVQWRRQFVTGERKV